MLLPSDVARLVLGYLQQEKLPSTCKSFISESPNLKEYAEHHTEDGAIPGCLLSLFGKNLTTILNEYVTLKAKENEAEIPFMMSSLWKKLDLTLSQIRCMQESAAFQTHQRARTRRGINDRMRQIMLTSPQAVLGSPVSHPVAPQTSTPVIATQYILQPIITQSASTSANNLSFNGQSSIQTSTSASNTVGETFQVASATSVQKKLSTAATSSPMRRKPDAQRRRRLAANTATEKDTGLDSDSIQGIIDDDFPQLVIENAREKILSNRSLQEKLAENINKILSSDSATQTSKQGDSAPTDDTSIDEILGLQGGEIHMSEEAIHDILVQTELDPDFQELYDLFACVMETSKGAQSTIIKAASPQIQEVEMENVTPGAKAAENVCFVKEDLPQASICKDNPLPASTESVKPTEIATAEDSAKGKLSDQSEQQTDKTAKATPPSCALQGAVLGSSATPQKDSEPVVMVSPENKPCRDPTAKQGRESDSAEKAVASQSAPVSVDHPESHEQSSVAPEIVIYSTEIEVSGDSQEVVTLNFITEDLPEDAEIHNAVKSINEETYPTIILSPIVKPQETRVGNAAGEAAEQTVPGDVSQLLATSTDTLMNSINLSNGDCTLYAVPGTSATADGNVIQLIPASGSTFTPNGSVFLSPCVANNVQAKQPSIVMLANGTNTVQKQGSLFQTPPRPGSMYSMGQAISPKLSQGSTFILASPVQPVLQGVMGMFPMSLVGQSGGTFTAQPHQILHVPISKPVVPKLPLPPKSQKPLPKVAAATAKPSSNPVVEPISRSSSSLQRENGVKSLASEPQPKPDERSLPETQNVVMKPLEAHRRVLCFDGTSKSPASVAQATLNAKAQKEDKGDSTQNPSPPTETVSSKRNVSKDSKKTESSEKDSKVDSGNASAKDPPVEKRLTSSNSESGGNKENVMQDAGTEKHGAGQERMTSQETLNIEKSGKSLQEAVRKQTPLPNILRKTPQKMSSERVCSTSPLAKQAGQLLQDIQFQSPTPKQRCPGDLPIPRTPGSGIEDRTDKPEHRRTPRSRRYHEDLGTPKPMMPPATPELPTCSPASEAGSESSVNMAAHTLMILSRASIAKSSSNTPLKDNTTQSKSSKSVSKKRRLEESDEYERRSQRKELLSPSSLHKKKKRKKRKRSMDSFPDGMDVDKFLMSLHYDE
ncbi:protein NPAT [Gastrophryne carolinensis]